MKSLASKCLLTITALSALYGGITAYASTSPAMESSAICCVQGDNFTCAINGKDQCVSANTICSPYGTCATFDEIN
jgi:hypothetical protein